MARNARRGGRRRDRLLLSERLVQGDHARKSRGAYPHHLRPQLVREGVHRNPLPRGARAPSSRAAGSRSSSQDRGLGLWSCSGVERQCLLTSACILASTADPLHNTVHCSTSEVLRSSAVPRSLSFSLCVPWFPDFPDSLFLYRSFCWLWAVFPLPLGLGLSWYL